MQSIYKYSDISMDKLERKCISIIEDDLDMFFNSCKKSAYAYSTMIAQDINKYNFDMFEKIVISSEEVKILIKRITQKLNIELENGMIFNNQTTKSLQFISHKLILDDSINNYKTTQKITKTCEKCINTAFSKTIKNICNNFALNLMFKKVNIGQKILGKNSYKNVSKIQQRKINNQIEGILINIKTDIRNQLIDEAIRNIHSIQEQNIYAIA